MITSDPRASGLRPALSPARRTYRPVSAKIIAAATRAGISFTAVENPLALDTSQYEFPGDRTYIRFREGGSR